MIRSILVIFFLMASSAAYAQQETELPHINDSSKSWQLQEMPSLEPSAEIQKNYVKTTECLSGPFPDQGFWFSCSLNQKVDSSKEGQWFQWLAMQGCDKTGQTYQLVLANQHVLTGLNNCRLLTSQIEPSDNPQELKVIFHLINQQGQVLWSYNRPEPGDFYLESQASAELPHRDLIIDYQNGYLLWDDHHLVRLDSKGQVIWRKSGTELIADQLKQFPDAEIGNTRSLPRLITDPKGQAYLSIPLVTTHGPQFLIYKIDSAGKVFEQVFSNQTIKGNEKDSEHFYPELMEYEMLILGNGHLAVLYSQQASDYYLGAYLALVEFNDATGQWHRLWKDKRWSYAGILSILQTPQGQFVLVDDLLYSTYTRYLTGDNDPEAGYKKDDIDYGIRVIQLGKSGYIESQKRFLIDPDLETTAESIWPIGYLNYSKPQELGIAIHPMPAYNYAVEGWQFYRLKLSK